MFPADAFKFYQDTKMTGLGRGVGKPPMQKVNNCLWDTSLQKGDFSAVEGCKWNSDEAEHNQNDLTNYFATEI